MGHLAIVNQETIKKVIEEGCISTRGDLKDKWIKTTADLFSDVLATRKGDFIFPWIIKNRDTKNEDPKRLGFKYVFKVAGSPVFIEGDEYPIKIPLEKEGIEYEIPLSEAEALDLWSTELLWNAIGKKSLGRGRSLTHQTPMEDLRMINMLEKKNNGSSTKIELKKFSTSGLKISINPSQYKWDDNFFKKLMKYPIRERISHLDIKRIPWRRNNLFIVEKVLEAWFMENIDKNKEIENKIIGKEKIEWFGNYLPFGVQGSNIDIIVIQMGNNDEKIIKIIELKMKGLNENEFKEAARQAVEYSFFIRDAFNAFKIPVKLETIVISGKSNVDKIKSITIKGVKPKWFTYDLNDEGNISFEEIL